MLAGIFMFFSIHTSEGKIMELFYEMLVTIMLSIVKVLPCLNVF